uniref:Uncharacterized protein n=1 Tax=Globodera rostochiensis TaxID=31243 RepID=A0A914I0Y2_GLORO
MAVHLLAISSSFFPPALIVVLLVVILAHFWQIFGPSGALCKFVRFGVEEVQAVRPATFWVLSASLGLTGHAVSAAVRDEIVPATA